MPDLRILLYCPLSPNPPGIYDQSLQGIFGLDWPYPIDYAFGRQDTPPGGDGGYDQITAKYNYARKLVLDNDYDALFTVESDMIIPSMTLQRLIRVEADVAYGLYCSRHGRHQWLAYAWMNDKNGESVDHGYEWCVDVWGQAAETMGVGLGCTLIWRRVLESIEFTRRGGSANDWYFSLDCRKNGFVQKHDFGIICGHIDKERDRIRVIWPSIENPLRMYEVKELT